MKWIEQQRLGEANKMRQIRARRIQFVRDHMPEIQNQNDRFHLGWDVHFMRRTLWIKSGRILQLQPQLVSARR